MSVERYRSIHDEWGVAPDPATFGVMAHVADPVRREELAQRTPWGVMEHYLGEMDSVWPGQLDRLEALAETFEKPTASSDPRVIVAIPVAGHQEAANIDRALGLYSEQLLDKDLWELVLFVNSPAVDQHGNPTSVQATLDEIEKGRAKYDLPNLRVLQHQYEDAVPIGTVRKDLWDSIVYDLYGREIEHPVLVVNNDIDVTRLPRAYVTEMAYRHFASRSSIVSGPLSFDRRTDTPMADKLITYWWQMYSAQCTKSRLQPSAEANMAIDLAAFCKLGGIDPTKQTHEIGDLLSRTLQLARSRYTKQYISEGWARRAHLQTSSRRQLATLALGHSLMDTWDPDKLVFSAHDELRSLPPTEAAEQRATADFLDHVAQIDRHFILNARLGREVVSDLWRFSEAAKRILGISAVIEDTRPKVTTKPAVAA